MDTPAILYILVIAAGLAVAAITYQEPLLGLAIWMAIIPLFASVVVPPGMEKIPPTRIVHLLMMGGAIAGTLHGRNRIQYRSPAIVAYFLFVSAAVLSALASGAPGESLGRAVSYAEPGVWLAIGAACKPERAERQVKYLLMGCAIGFALVVILSVPEVQQQRNYLVESGLVHSDRNYMSDRRLGVSGRVVSTLGQPVYGGIYALVCLCALHLLLRRGADRALTRLMLGGLLLAGSVFLFLTGTRAAVLGFLLYPALFFGFARDRAALWKVLSFYALCIGAIITVVPGRFLEFFQTSFSLTAATQSSANVIGRLALTKRLFEIFLTHPFLGVGPGYIQKAVYSHGAGSLLGLEGVENQYALLLAENGLLGFALYGAFAVVVLRAALGNSASKEGTLGRGGLGHWLAAVFLCLLLIASSCSLISSLPTFYVMAFVGVLAAVRFAGKSGVHQPGEIHRGSPLAGILN